MVGGTNLNLINAKSRDDCVHKGPRSPRARLGDLLRDAEASLAGIIYIDIYAVS